jgi:hypothetical protein
MRYALIIAAVLLTGCHHEKDKREAGPSGLPLSCTPLVTQYSGAIDATPVLDGLGFETTKRQRVVINADVIEHPSDSIDVHLCTPTDCDQTTPAPFIVYGHNEVEFVNAHQPFTKNGGTTQFVRYEIETVICR